MMISMLVFRLALAIAAAVALTLSVGWGMQWVKSKGHQLTVSQLNAKLATQEGERAFCESQRLGLYREVGLIRAELAALEESSRRRIAVANTIITQAEAEQAAYQQELERLRRQWPDDALSAVARVREEMGL